MSALPPPLPPALPDMRPPGNSFVTVLAWLSIAAGALGVVYGVIQLCTALFMPQLQMQMLNPTGAPLPPLPPLMDWYYANNFWIALATVLTSTALLAVSRGVLRRREWARRAFIALLVLGTLWQLAWVWAMPQIVEGTLAVQMATLPGEDAAELVDGMVNMATVITALIVLVFLALHAWIAWKLCTPTVRAEFER